MNLYIGGVDHTPELQEGTLIIRQFGAARSSTKATLFFQKIPKHYPAVGEEITVQEKGVVIWGGIVVETEAECHDTTRTTLKLRAQGYEQILQRFCLPGIQLEDRTPSSATVHIFTLYLNAQDGLVLGEVEPGYSTMNQYKFYPAKAASVFDFLAAENGFLWWVDKNKKFYMRSSLPNGNKTVSIDLTGADRNRLTDLQTLVFRGSTAGYKNTQYAFNKTTHTYGYATNFNAVQQMAYRYGSGSYGASASSSIIYTPSDGTHVAQQNLAGSPGTGEIEFTTDENAFSLGQLLDVTAPVCGINDPTLFCVTEIRAVYFYDRFRYTVTAKESYEGSLYTGSWQATLAGGSTAVER